MTKEEKRELYRPKRWALYEDDEFVSSYMSHKAAKAALSRKVNLMKKYPYDFADVCRYSIRPCEK